jgi:hypothetical protein
MTKGSDLLVSALANEGVERIFGVPGEENLDVVESLRNSKIKLILTRQLVKKPSRTNIFDGSTTGTKTHYVTLPGTYVEIAASFLTSE